MGTERLMQNSLALEIEALAARGIRKLLVTSGTPGEGKSSVTAEAGQELARSGRRSVVLVDADPFNASLHLLFGLPVGRGVGELIEEVYLADPMKVDPQQFGIGDWLELLRAQGRSGELLVREDGDAYSVRLVRGSACSITCLEHPNGTRLADLLVKRHRITPKEKEDALKVQQEIGRPLGEVLKTLGYATSADMADALQAQLAHRLAKIIALKQPECRFAETAESYLPAAGGRPPDAPDEGAVEQLVSGRIHHYLRHPYLSSQIPSYLSDTQLPNLKVLTAGRRLRDLQSPGLLEPFGVLLDRLGAVFDLVLVDAPPVSRAGPTNPLVRLAHGVLLTVRAERADLPGIRRTIEELRRAGGSVVGVALTQIQGAREGVPSRNGERSNGHVG